VGHNSKGELHIVRGKHVDDLKVGSENHRVQKLRTSLEAVFGTRQVSLQKFTNVVRQNLGDRPKQERVNAIHTIPPEFYSGKRGDDKCTEQQMSMLWSLVGVLGHAMITQ
ncbi:unnamed protein product, partial [Prorocentrum cordatum]